MSDRYPQGLRGDIARLLSPQGLHEGKPSFAKALQRVVTRPGPLAILLYRLSHRLWIRGWETPAEILWRINLFLTGADIHPGAEIGGGLRLTHTSGLVIGKGVVIGSNVTLLHEVTLGGSARALLEEGFIDGFPTIGDGTRISAGAKVLGPITVGNECFIGANAVVAKDLPDKTVYTPGRETGDLLRRIDTLENELRALKATLAQGDGDVSDDRTTA